MLIYSENISPRLRYIAEFILGDLLGVQPVFTTVRSDASGYDGPVISYSAQPVEGSLQILPSGFLEEDTIRMFNPEVTDSGDRTLLFPSTEGNLHFDIFSAAFYLVTRYEEYLAFTADQHGRFPATESLAFRQGFLDVPVINRWANTLSAELQRIYPRFLISRPGPSFCPTIDIDVAWAIRNRGLYMTLGGMARQAFSGNVRGLAERIAILRGSQPDPYDSYTFIREKHDQSLTIFLLAGSGGKFDLNTPVHHPAWRRLARDLSSEFRTGFHPSYHTGEDLQLFRAERKILEEVTGHPVTRLRQHFLRLNFPATYRRSAEEGFEEDYSMGYADRTGFRAGTSSPFNFFDLERNQMTSLKVFPFAVMDRTLKDYLKLSPAEAIRKITELVSVVGKEGGYFIPVWHNDSLGNKGEWIGWSAVYEDMLSQIKETY